MFVVVLTRRARRFLEAAPVDLQRRLRTALERLARDPHRAPGVKALRGELAGICRCRIGDYRVLFQIDESARRVVVLAIAHRREAYR